MQEHGTYSRYTIGRCRCTSCKKANSDYEKRRLRLKAYGRFPWVEPEHSRKHLLELLAEGCGLRTISKVSGVSRTTLQALINGKQHPCGGRRPLRRVHAETERKILAVDYGRAAPPDTLPAKESWIQIQEMLDFGLTKATIARAMGKETPALQLSRHRISTVNARKITTLHWGVWLNSPSFRQACRCPLPARVSERLEHDAA